MKSEKKMNKIWLLIPLTIALLLIAGCGTIRHKVFRMVNSGIGGKMVTIDPIDGGAPTPTIMVGSYFNSVTTIPVGTIAHYKAKSYGIFSNQKLFEEEMTIDSTHGKMTITKKKVEFGSK